MYPQELPVMYSVLYLYRYNSTVHSGPDRRGKVVCGMQASGYHHIPEQARHRRVGIMLAVVSDLEYSSSSRLGELPAGGGGNVLRS